MPLCLTRREVEATDAAVVPALLEVREDYSGYTPKCIISFCNKEPPENSPFFARKQENS